MNEDLPVQLELPLAWVKGEPITRLPKNLYIPPKALKVLLETFEGPLDLLSYLIKVNRFDIADIPVVEITRQYQVYLGMMQELDMELAAEYLYMAAWLTEIKSRILLPQPPAIDDEPLEEDPREALMQQLLEYQAYQHSASWLAEWVTQAHADYPVTLVPDWEEVESLTAQQTPSTPNIAMADLWQAMSRVINRQALVKPHRVGEEKILISQKITYIEQCLAKRPAQRLSLVELMISNEGKPGLVVTFIALLELWRQRRVQLFQHEADQWLEVEAVAS
ncbi:ScpA family protein [Thiomicrospira sp. ALE5]|uniref:segregation and condensation protein A n=1 Tax=Thiomicrospira sp. ALE5 TaxID=748650 RepID=UPI0008DED606|nr:segregation/condensation protein A [Thiomicrospira sp. ALE5]SFR50237.1 condensin subunit ScpA [Thiomicrospira sp. ALE5]